MLFNSFEFFIFLPIVFTLYWWLFQHNHKVQNILLLVASYFFYGWWSWEFMGLLMLSTLLDYLYGFWVASPNRVRAKFFLWLSIINNLGILGVFKYFNFFSIEMAHGFEKLGWQIQPWILDIALPVGISFYTFHGMSYVFDIYRGQQNPMKRFVDYGVFVSFFPLLVAGPIERANHLLPQVQRPRIFQLDQALNGARLMLWGLFKKVIIADGLASIVDPIFSHYMDYGAFTLMLAAIGFAFQIYCDFSGYSDIALGTAQLFGFELLSNFRFPYFSRDIAEFWRRWHISLSSWFRDYLYIPLGGSRNGKWKAARNTFIIFLVSGFWHGANWTFIIWGLLHAVAFLPLLLFNRNRKYAHEVVAHDRYFPNFKEFLQILSTFAFVTFAWIFFRMDNITDAVRFCIRIKENAISYPDQFLEVPIGIIVFAYIIPLLLLDWQFRRNERTPLNFSNHRVRQFAFLILLLALLIVGFGETTSFIYFVF